MRQHDRNNPRPGIEKTRSAVFLGEQPAFRGGGAKRTEESDPRKRHVHAFRSTLSGAEIEHAFVVDADRTEDVPLFRVVKQQSARQAGVLQVQSRGVVRHGDEPVTVWERQRPEDDGVEEREYRRHRARAHRQNNQHDEREAVRAPERADRVREIAAKVIEPEEAGLVAIGLFRHGHGAEVSPSRPARVFGRETLANVVISSFVEVRVDLVPELAFATARPAEPAQPCQQDPQLRHDSSWMVKKRATMPVACCHAAASTRS